MLMGDLGAEGNEASKARLILLARDMAERKGVDPALVCGLCEVESAWEPWAVRYELGYKWLWGFGGEDDEDIDEGSSGYFVPFPTVCELNVKYPKPERIKDLPEILNDKWEGALLELVEEQISWGLMQVMGAVARERGLKGWLTRMLQPEVNLSIGIKHLQWLKGRWPERKKIISAWNQSSPQRHVGRGGARIGKYVNQAYVDKVLAAMGGYQT